MVSFTVGARSGFFDCSIQSEITPVAFLAEGLLDRMGGVIWKLEFFDPSLCRHNTFKTFCNPLKDTLVSTQISAVRHLQRKLHDLNKKRPDKVIGFTQSSYPAY